MPPPPDTPRAPRPGVSNADVHRRRRRIAGLGLAAAGVLFIAIVAVSAGQDGAWDPAGLRADAIAQAPKLRLEAEAREAAAVLARQRRERETQEAAIADTLKDTGFVNRAGGGARRIALTFDDGPSPYTQRILDTLQRGGAKATFFVLGSQIAEHPIPLQRAVAAGHAIANHSWSHADLTRLGAGGVAEELRRTNRALEDAGIPQPRLFRPPYGAYDERTLGAARREGMLTTLWTVDTNDYRASDPQAMARQVLDAAQPGAIVLMHDGGGDRTVTGRALPLIVRGLAREGYEMVTLPELLVENPAPADQQAVGRSERA